MLTRPSLVSRVEPAIPARSRLQQGGLPAACPILPLLDAVCGDLPMVPETIRVKTEEIAATGVDYVKIGFFPSGDAEASATATNR